MRSRLIRTPRARLTMLVVAAAAGFMLFVPGALAVHDLAFQLDGDISSTTSGQCSQADLACAGTESPNGFDWSSFFANDSSGAIRTSLGLTDANRTVGTPGGYPSPALPDASRPGFEKSVFAKDFVTGSTSDLSTFATGTKDIQAIDGGGLDQSGSWQCTGSNNVGDKVDLYDSYGLLYKDPSSHHNVIYAGLERGSPNGTADAGFWLLKDNHAGCTGVLGTNSNWTGQHLSGDILVLVEYTGGGQVTTVNVFQWQGGVHGCLSNKNNPATPGLPLTAKDCNEQPIVTSHNDCKTTAVADSVCATANGDPAACASGGGCKAPNFLIAPPWATPTPLNTPQFLEMGLDLTAFNLDVGCFSKMLPDTRSSATPTATLFDYTLSSFNTCTSTTVTAPDASTVAVNGTIHDVATVSGTSFFGSAPAPTGSVTFYVCGPDATSTINSCSSTSQSVGTTNIASGNTSNPVNVTSPAFTPTQPGKYCFFAVYSGDSNYPSSSDGRSNECFFVPATPTIVTTANPTGTITLGTTSPTLKDSAVLAGGLSPTGTITFTLSYNGSTVDTETATVNGNGTYTTPVGYTLPHTGTVTGTYTWHATYSGDSTNGGAVDQGGSSEQVTVNPASPSLVTTANPTGTITLGTTAPTLKDSAVLSGGYFPTGTITFTLKLGSTTVDTESVTVNGNGTYTTPNGYTATAIGTYTWTASYVSGDGNNNAASDQGGTSEQVTLTPPSTNLVTTANPTGTITLGTTAPTLNDSAVLSGGLSPTGSITFTLKLGSTTVDTESVTVNGNGTYSTPTGYTLPTTGTVTGTYTWSAHYSGDSNNQPSDDQGGTSEQVTVNPASPTLVTTANPTGSVTLTPTSSITLQDSAVLSGGYFPTGSITFTLKLGSTTLDTETIPVSGNGTYTTTGGYTVPTTGTVTGTYKWTATYGGDGNNGTATDDGSSAAEQLTVNPASPAINTTPNPSAGSVGVTLNDTGTLSGGYNPTGTITFSLYAPSDSSCTGTAAFTNTVSVSGNGTYSTSSGFAANAVGTWHWKASYSGDGNNNAANSTCADEPVTITGGQGCTPGFWKNHTNAWDGTNDTVTQALFSAVQSAATATGISFSVDTSKGGTSQLFKSVFALNGSNLRGVSSNTTLSDALNLGGGDFNALARHGTAALLSSVSVAYPYSAQQVLVGVHNAFVDNNSNEISSAFPHGVLTDLTAANNLDESACPTG